MIVYQTIQQRLLFRWVPLGIVQRVNVHAQSGMAKIPSIHSLTDRDHSMMSIAPHSEPTPKQLPQHCRIATRN